MSFKKIILCLMVSMQSAQAMVAPATATITIPPATINIPQLNAFMQSTTQQTQALTKSIDRLINALRPSGIGTLALVVGCYSAHQLFNKYPSKPVAERTQSDWVIPAAGLAVSAGTLLFLWSLEYRK